MELFQLHTYGSFEAELAFEGLYLGGCLLGAAVGAMRLLQMCFLVAFPERGGRNVAATGWLALANVAGVLAALVPFADRQLCLGMGENVSAQYSQVGLLVPFFAMYVLVFELLFLHREALLRQQASVDTLLGAPRKSGETSKGAIEDAKKTK